MHAFSSITQISIIQAIGPPNYAVSKNLESLLKKLLKYFIEIIHHEMAEKYSQCGRSQKKH